MPLNARICRSTSALEWQGKVCGIEPVTVIWQAIGERKGLATQRMVVFEQGKPCGHFGRRQRRPIAVVVFSVIRCFARFRQRCSGQAEPGAGQDPAQQGWLYWAIQKKAEDRCWVALKVALAGLDPVAESLALDWGNAVVQERHLKDLRLPWRRYPAGIDVENEG